MTITARPVTASDLGALVAMRARLYVDASAEELADEAEQLVGPEPRWAAFIAEENGQALGFVEVAMRSYAEGGPDAPAGYLEGIWVEPGARRRGVAKILLATAEKWARERGFTWLGSDARLENAASQAWHGAAGFAEIERVVVYGKQLG